jgi:hypothetical protein
MPANEYKPRPHKAADSLGTEDMQINAYAKEMEKWAQKVTKWINEASAGGGGPDPIDEPPVPPFE